MLNHLRPGTDRGTRRACLRGQGQEGAGGGGRQHGSSPLPDPPTLAKDDLGVGPGVGVWGLTCCSAPQSVEKYPDLCRSCCPGSGTPARRSPSSSRSSGGQLLLYRWVSSGLWLRCSDEGSTKGAGSSSDGAELDLGQGSVVAGTLAPGAKGQTADSGCLGLAACGVCGSGARLSSGLSFLSRGPSNSPRIPLHPKLGYSLTLSPRPRL